MLTVVVMVVMLIVMMVMVVVGGDGCGGDDGVQDCYNDIPDVHDGDGKYDCVDHVPDGDTGRVLLVLPVDDHPVARVTVHTVLDCRVQLQGVDSVNTYLIVQTQYTRYWYRTLGTVHQVHLPDAVCQI